MSNTGAFFLLSPREQIVYEEIKKAAQEGRPCPKNDELSEAMNSYSNATPARAVRRLEELGLISLPQRGRNRVIEITDTGERTAGEVGVKEYNTPTGTRKRKKPTVTLPKTERIKGRNKDLINTPLGIAPLRGHSIRHKTCQWINGDPSDRNFCGDPVRQGSSYCERHHARCYYKPKEKTNAI